MHDWLKRWKRSGFIQLNYIPEFVHFIIRIKSNTLECRKENEWNLEKIVFGTIVPLELDLEDQFRSSKHNLVHIANNLNIEAVWINITVSDASVRWWRNRSKAFLKMKQYETV